MANGNLPARASPAGHANKKMEVTMLHNIMYVYEYIIIVKH
jgi:hypothetical protein